MILLTGASGYIGSAVYAALKQQGIPVLTAGRNACDRFLDLSQCSCLSGLFTEITVVIHCAGIAHNKGDFSAYQLLNVEACSALASAALTAGVKQFIFLSSLNVVPATMPDPGTTAAAIPKPGSPYAESKWRAEIALSKLLGSSPCELVILRPALVYDHTLTANLAALKKWQRLLPVSLPALGHRSLVARPDLVALVVSLLRGEGEEYRSREHPLAVTDGQCYTASRIGKALRIKATLSLPTLVWRMILVCLAGLPFHKTRTLAASLGGTYWCGEAAQPFNRAVWSLERLLHSSEVEDAA
ncbi:MAG: NAD-dependent epimerase/dehydratase family protein [Luminiphilus sp.]|nr:NAD-dependent epimerase/dehydratase family protein [Luminiphilus sp.]